MDPADTEFLKVGLWAYPVAIDYDGDGDLDLVVSCPGNPHHGTWLFENPTKSDECRPMPVFKRAVLLSERAEHCLVRANARRDSPVTLPGRMTARFAKDLYDGFRPVSGLPENVHSCGVRSNVWRLSDLNGDGLDDVVVGVGDWSEYGWNDRYDACGNWTNRMVRGYVYLALRLGRQSGYAPAERLRDVEGRFLETDGAPMPMAEDWNGDGKVDLLCGSFVNDFTFFRNIGDTHQPRFAPAAPVKTEDGSRLEMGLAMITPSAVDWDGDGDLDIICGDEDGRVAFIENTGVIRDGAPVFRQPQYFRQEADRVAFGALVTPSAVDWDGDGDVDLVCGDSAGELAFVENRSGKGVDNPVWAEPVKLREIGSEKPLRIRAGYNGSIQGPIERNWGYTVPSVADWDGDGFLDVVVNSIHGDVGWYRNPGRRGTLELEPFRAVDVEWTAPQPALAWGWRKPKGKALLTQWRTTPLATDWTGDGLVDLLMLDQEGYLTLFERRRDASGSLRLKAPRRAFFWEDGRPMQLATGWAGASGRRKFCLTDFNGDGLKDIVINGFNADLYQQVRQEEGAWFFRNTGRMGERRLHNHTTAPTAADFDGDGREDIVLGAEDGFFYVLRNTGKECRAAFRENVGFVDPLIGTACRRVDESNSAGMVPAVGVPFGGVKWVPMTRLSEIGRVSYGDRDPNFLGFVGTRQPSPWMGDFGQFSVQARVGTVETDFARRRYAFDRAKSVFTPYYCKVVDASGVVSEVAAASHAAILRFTFPKGATVRHLVIDASRTYRGGLTERRPALGGIDFSDGLHRCVFARNHDLMNAELDPALSNWCGFARFDLSKPYIESGTYADGRLSPGSASALGDACGGWMTFGPETETVVVKVGLSAVSAGKTYNNQVEELGGFGGDEFGELVERGRREWNRKLATVEIEADDDVKKVFYTALYHALQFPAEFSEAGKYYSAYDLKVHDGVAYTSYSLWDTYRAEHPLLTLVAPERVDGMVNSLLAAYREGGWLPKWPNPGYTGIMVGGPAEIVLAEAWVKGFRGFDVNLAYEAVRKNATIPQPNDRACRWPDRAKWCGHPETRAGLSGYQTLGYVAADRTNESVSRTQDFGHDDLAAAALAEATGHHDEARAFRLRSRNYTNLWNAAAGTFLPRNADGSWSFPPGDLELPEGERWKAVNYTEQTPQTACWGIAYDTVGVAAMMGGKAAMEARLDGYFAHHFYNKAKGTMSYHENETTHHVAYLYADLGAFDKCARQVRRILTTGYSAEPWGMEGNDDCGQMSAWYVFSALGFYPLDPVSGEYVIGSPLVSRATLRIGAPYSPSVFTIVVANQARENSLVKSVKLNGVELTRRRLRHADVVAGGLLEFEMMRDVKVFGEINCKGKEGMK